MPVAIASNQTKRFELKSLPGAFVEIRRMNYGEILRRQAETSAMKIKQGASVEDVEAVMNMVNITATENDFKNCIADHNLEITEGQPIDFKKREHVRMLDGRVGQEILKFINEWNNLDERDSGNSGQGSETES